MVEVSRDGRRVYVTNSLYAAWDDLFYPRGWGLAGQAGGRPRGRRHHRRPGFFPSGEALCGLRVHQTRLQGGDASSDSYCHTR
jgi:methanethiol oxidase